MTLLVAVSWIPDAMMGWEPIGDLSPNMEPALSILYQRALVVNTEKAPNGKAELYWKWVGFTDTPDVPQELAVVEGPVHMRHPINTHGVPPAVEVYLGRFLRRASGDPGDMSREAQDAKDALSWLEIALLNRIRENPRLGDEITHGDGTRLIVQSVEEDAHGVQQVYFYEETWTDNMHRRSMPISRWRECRFWGAIKVTSNINTEWEP